MVKKEVKDIFKEYARVSCFVIFSNILDDFFLELKFLIEGNTLRYNIRM